MSGIDEAHYKEYKPNVCGLIDLWSEIRTSLCNILGPFISTILSSLIIQLSSKILSQWVKYGNDQTCSIISWIIMRYQLQKI